MSVLRPFPGLVVDPKWAHRVTTGPYDAYTAAERVAIAESNPYSFLNVTRSQEDVPAEWRDDVDWLIGQCAESMQRIYDAGAYNPTTSRRCSCTGWRSATTSKQGSWAWSR
ncbi:MAG: hypothetical protein CM1200mP26_05100 [Acidimicrobiales bacterium]|nr:MAG: hypothetical protein CM1200mP26_05100 [Acidimicrobiales bacterium]